MEDLATVSDVYKSGGALLCNMFIPVVTVDPSGPLYLPISTQRNITCSIEGGTLNHVVVTFSDKDSVKYTLLPGRERVPGIVITSSYLTRVLISINIEDASVTGIRCEGTIETSNGTTAPGEDTLNLTIFGK